MRQLAPPARLLAALTLSCAVACDAPAISEPEPVEDADAADGAGGDVAADTAAGPDARDTAEPDAGDPRIFCDPVNEGEDCPGDLFCHSRSRFCIESLFDEERCTEEGTREVCEAAESPGPGLLEGGFCHEEPCDPLHVCDPSNTRCEPIVCTPNSRTCEDSTTASVCNGIGTRRSEQACDSGRACYGDGECQRIRNNVLLLFDTSGSMNAPIDPDSVAPNCKGTAITCLEPFPVCDDPEAPVMMFTLAKRVFAETIQEAISGESQFALQRFPQRERTIVEGSCGAGWYSGDVKIQGDDDSHSSEGKSWFTDNLSDALVVPFPARAQQDNSNQLLRWLDFEEELRPMGQSCQTSQDCPDGIRCDVETTGYCEVHSNHELRASGGTPLGRSLYYAGEYFRRFVLIDGKPCEATKDCRSSGYVCDQDEGVCRDPYRHCRDHWIVVFTDGEESQATEVTEFFHPVNQAKRLAYGLGCDGEGDCRGEATCEGGFCLGPDQSEGDVPKFSDPKGYDALSRPDGSPVSIRTAVMNFRRSQTSGGLDKNDRIARAGGGSAVDVFANDPEELQQELRKLMARELKCEPEDF